MNDSYINKVRESLYQKPEKKPGTSKVIKFLEDSYRSENVFENVSKPPSKSNKSAVPKCTPIKKKEKTKLLVGKSYLTNRNKISSRRSHIKKKSKKNDKVVSSVNSELGRTITNFLSPSKSGITNSSFTCEEFNTNCSEDESTAEFDIDTFFDSRNQSFNESISNIHSGIEYEFNTNYIQSTIRSSENSESSKEIEDITVSTENLNVSSKSHKHSGYLKLEQETCSSSPNKTIKLTQLDRKAKNKKQKAAALDDSLLNQNKDKQEFNIKNVISISDEEEDVIRISDDETKNNIPHDTKANLITHVPVRNDVINSQNNSDVKLETVNDINKNLEPVFFDIFDPESKEFSRVLILKQDNFITVYGFFSLKVLHGEVEIFGSILDASSKNLSLYSPRGSALLILRNVTNNAQHTKLKTILPLSNAIQTVKDMIIDANTAVLQCSKLFDNHILFIEKYIPQQIFPKCGNTMPQMIIEPKNEWGTLTVNSYWDYIADFIDPSTKLLVAGGKGVGKSTFIRYIINKLLMKYREIRVVDLDPGQSEFFVPACISVSSIKEPIFGPNYTHLRKPQRCYLSDINIGHDPMSYIKCISALTDYISMLDVVPTLINYMGFAKGIGLQIISSAITYIQPTDIVQIDSSSRNKNFISDLTVETITNNCHFFGGNTDNLHFNLHKIPSMADQKGGGWVLEPRQIREMCVLAYLGQMTGKNISSLTSSEMPMYQIQLSSIKITNLQKEELPPAAVNANLVALCNLEEESNCFICLGYGVVRGIDLNSEILVLLTPEPIEVLEEVYYLVLGSVSLPPSVYMNPDDIAGSVPYVMEGELVSLGQITRRSYLPSNKK